jgi:hypothetical protein
MLYSTMRRKNSISTEYPSGLYGQVALTSD